MSDQPAPTPAPERTVVAEACKFKFYSDDTVEGPAEYLNERGQQVIDDIANGRSVVFNTGCRLSPSMEMAVCVTLQTDYAGWLGMKQAEGWLKGGK